MAKKLNTFVWLRKPDGIDQVSFAPGENLPEWAKKALADSPHLFDGADEDESTEVHIPLPKDRDQTPKDYALTGESVGKEPAATEEGKTQLVPTEDDEADEDEGPAVPKGNASREAWALFADEAGVPVTDKMSRDDIKAACAEAGVLDDE
ncbi:hypothetical protein QLT00_gp32 [Gordonia phage Commandaria]|uniref:Head-to-tail connector protein n=1 Tax=Gordonia phage Commandaria TaxID=3038364 RepID=A0AAF0K0Y2_9CAUD|nr:hypothetical protein QLT00_gp32 [Gordonia phage Commandaria]WGH20815.1 hypothetical protein [Gordonia phage Commandaria]